MTFGYCRDAAESGFLLKYVEDGILEAFQTLDDGVVALMRIAVDKGRATNPNLEIGICGEHGGDPASIKKCEARPRLRVLLAVPSARRAPRSRPGEHCSGPTRRSSTAREPNNGSLTPNRWAQCRACARANH